MLLTSLSVSKQRHSKAKEVKNDEVFETKYNEYGSIPAIEYAYKAIERAPCIVVLRAQNQSTSCEECEEYIVVGYRRNRAFQLQSPVTQNLLNVLISPNKLLLMTGISSDCRNVLRFAKQMVLNYSIAMDADPSGERIATKIGNFMQTAYSDGGGSRPFACHSFVISTTEGAIFEISCAGSVSQVIGGVAGGNLFKTKTILESEYHNNLTIEQAKQLIDDVLNAAYDGSKSSLSGDKNDDTDIDPPDIVHRYHVLRNHRSSMES
eukprot:gene6337-8725_t